MRSRIGRVERLVAAADNTTRAVRHFDPAVIGDWPRLVARRHGRARDPYRVQRVVALHAIGRYVVRVIKWKARMARVMWAQSELSNQLHGGIRQQ